MDRLILCFEPGLGLLLVASPNVCGHDARRATLGPDGCPKGFAAIGAVGENFTWILRKSFSACLAVTEVGRGVGDFLDETGFSIGADVRLEAVHRWPAIVYHPPGFVIAFTGRGDDSGGDDSTRLHTHCLGLQLRGPVIGKFLIEPSGAQRLAKSNEGCKLRGMIQSRKSAETAKWFSVVKRICKVHV